MKKVLVMMASYFNKQSRITINDERTALYDCFSDKINMVRDEIDKIVVHFTRNDSVYSLHKNHPRFGELFAKLEKLKKEQKKVKIVAIIPMMEIREIAE